MLWRNTEDKAWKARQQKTKAALWRNAARHKNRESEAKATIQTPKRPTPANHNNRLFDITYFMPHKIFKSFTRNMFKSSAAVQQQQQQHSNKNINTPWWTGVPTKLIKKTTLVKESENHLPVYTLTFAVPQDATFGGGRARPHSAVRIDMGDVVKMVIPGYKPKSYSMSEFRGDEFDITIKVYPNGRASGYLDRLKVGVDTINTFGMSAGRTRNPGKFVGIISYGVGITEALPVAQAELEKGDASERVVLLWASRTMHDTFWHDKIEQLQEQYPKRFQIIYILSREQKENCLHGHINPRIINEVFRPANKNDARFLSVGTKEMMAMTDRMFITAGYSMPKNALLPK